MQILFEASFSGLLSAAAWCYRRNEMPTMMLTADDPPSLLPAVFIPEEKDIESLFQRHLTSLMKQAEAESVLLNCLHAWYGGRSELALQIVRYIMLAMQSKSDPSSQLYEPCVSAVINAAGKARRQAHHYLGALRFKKVTDKLFLADFDPDAILLPLVMPHFCDRFSDQNFVIRDLRHSEAGLHLTDGRWRIFKLTDIPSVRSDNQWRLPDISEQEETALTGYGDMTKEHTEVDYADLWQQYLENLAIPERKNLKLQRQNLPLKYRKYMGEGF